MQDFSINIKHMSMAFGGYQYLLVITCDQTNFTIVTPLRSRDVQSVAKAYIYVTQLRSGEDPELQNTLKNASY